MEERSGLSHLELFPTAYADSRFFGEIKLSDSQLKARLNITDAGASRTDLLAMTAALEALEDSQLRPEEIKSYDTALIGANTVGGISFTDELYRDANGLSHQSPYASSYDSGAVTLFLQRQLGVKGIINTINTACSSSANAIAYGARLIKHGLAKRAIVGGADSLAKFTINGFNSLHILSPEICRPFDAERQGLNLGEAAAFLILEREEDVPHKRVYACLSGTANTNDAYHPSSISDEGEGPYLAMKRSLEEAGLQASNVSYINAHGTGTENNDASESVAMIRLFENIPPFASTKAYTGHTLGAAGAVEAAFGVLNLYHQELYPNLHFENPIQATGLMPQRRYTKGAIEHVMSNSFGFGGNCSSLILSRI